MTDWLIFLKDFAFLPALIFIFTYIFLCFLDLRRDLLTHLTDLEDRQSLILIKVRIWDWFFRWDYTALLILFTFLIHTGITTSFVNWFFRTNFLRIDIFFLISLISSLELFLCHWIRNKLFLFFLLDKTQLLFTWLSLTAIPTMLLCIDFISWLRSLLILCSPLFLSFTSFWKGDIARPSKAINIHFLLYIKDFYIRFA